MFLIAKLFSAFIDASWTSMRLMATSDLLVRGRTERMTPILDLTPVRERWSRRCQEPRVWRRPGLLTISAVTTSRVARGAATGAMQGWIGSAASPDDSAARESCGLDARVDMARQHVSVGDRGGNEALFPIHRPGCQSVRR
jgi:hypothetical protein